MMQTAARLAVLFAAAAMAYAGAFKLSERDAFRVALASHGLLPESSIALAVDVVPIAEIAVAIVAMIGVSATRNGGSVALMLALVYAAFSAYLVILHFRPPSQPASCGCGFGRGPVESWIALAGRNALIAGVLTAASVSLRKAPAPPHSRGQAQ